MRIDPARVTLAFHSPTPFRFLVILSSVSSTEGSCFLSLLNSKDKNRLRTSQLSIFLSFSSHFFPPQTLEIPRSFFQTRIARERKRARVRAFCREKIMATSLAAASSATPVGKTSSFSLSSQRLSRHGKVSFRISPRPKLLLASKGSRTSWNHFAVTRAQLNEVTVDESSNASPTPATKSEVPSPKQKDIKPEPSLPLSEASISEFMTQVASIVKLVDSRDIMELQLKQTDCELIIRKKEALPQPPAPAPFMMQSMAPPMPSYRPTQTAAAPPPAAAAPAAPPAVKPAKSSHPSLKCPMAGTFYRSSAPGEAPFVKVGDPVKKGQVLCIIEAMKLMNEIEADQSGKLVEILVDDGKPVSVDTPLFVIEP